MEEYKFPSAGQTASQLDPDADPSVTSIPLVDPQLVRRAFEQNQQVRGYYSVADVLDVDHYDINGVDRALVLGVRELDQDRLSSDVQNWLNLHTVYTHGNDLIAAYANQRNGEDQALGGSGTSNADKTQWAAGLPDRPGRPRAGRRRLRDPRLLRREQPRLLGRRQGLRQRARRRARPAARR